MRVPLRPTVSTATDAATECSGADGRLIDDGKKKNETKRKYKTKIIMKETNDDERRWEKNPVLIVPTAPIKILLLLFIYNSCMVHGSTSCVWTAAEVMDRDYVYTIL